MFKIDKLKISTQQQTNPSSCDWNNLSTDGQYALIIYAHTIFEKSKIFKSFLAYTKTELSDYFDTIHFAYLQGNQINTVSPSLIPFAKGRTITIRYNNLTYGIYYNVFRSRMIRENKQIHKDQPFDITSPHITPLTSEELALWDNSAQIRLPFTLQPKYVLLKDTLLQLRDISTLDFLLKDIPAFTSLPEAIKQRIINCEFWYDQKQELTQQNIDDMCFLLLQEYNDQQTKAIYARMHSYNMSITQAEENISNYLMNLADLKDQLALHQVHTNTIKLERITYNPLIKRIHYEPNGIHIDTDLIFLNFDTSKTGLLRNLSPNIEEAVKNGKLFCIGRHTIVINKALQIICSPMLTQYKNYHLEDYHCFGTYADHISVARKEGNIAQLFTLALHSLSSATIGDPAGNSTIRNALIVNPDYTVNVVIPGTDKTYITHVRKYFDELEHNNDL
jgi:hypothetical protein